MPTAMKHIVLAALAVAVLTVAAPYPAAAIVDLGEICFGFTGAGDTIRVEALVGANVVALSIRWRGGAVYELGGSGSASASSLGPVGSLFLALTAVHNTGSFGGNHICSLFATLVPPGFTGTAVIQCAGTGTAFNTSAPINPIACAAAIDAAPDGGKLLGDPQ